MKSAIIKANSIEEFETVEPCFISELWNRPEDANVSVAKARVKLGIKTRFHYLKGVNERYLIVAGNGVVEVEDLSPTEVEAGDLVVIPAGKNNE